jgi:uncharacterized protein (TIGR03066 family)
VVGAVAALWVSSCSRSPDAKLVGTWETEIGKAKARVTYFDDHTVTATVEGQVAGSTEGTWRIEGDQLITQVRKSTLKPDNQGKEFRDAIAELEDDRLVVMDSDRNVLTYKRVK